MKKIIIPALLIMLGSIISAFAIQKTEATTGHQFSNQYWHFTGSSSPEESDPSKYLPISDPDEPDCQGTLLRCVIEAPASSGNSSQPDLSAVTVISRKN